MSFMCTYSVGIRCVDVAVFLCPAPFLTVHTHTTRNNSLYRFEISDPVTTGLPLVAEFSMQLTVVSSLYRELLAAMFVTEE